MSVRDIERALDELLGLVLEVKQASWKMPPSDELRRALQALFEECTGWSGRLAELASARGGSLADVSTVAGRRPADLFPGDVDHAGLVAFFDAHLTEEIDRVRAHADACRDDDAEGAAALDEIAAGLRRHRIRIAALA